MSFRPTTSQIEAALVHAGTCSPLESCGVIAAGRFLAVANLATDPGHFIMDRGGFARIDTATPVEAIVHSHVGYPAVAGDSDKAGCAATGLPWVIVSVPSGTWCQIEPAPLSAPLIGRVWQWGVTDCYALVRDAYRAYAGIELPDYGRAWEFWKTEDIISGRVEENGFVRLPPGTKPRHCDVLGMRFQSEVVNHLAVFLEPDLILHQLYQRLSVRELYSGPYQQRTVLHLRHARLA